MKRKLSIGLMSIVAAMVMVSFMFNGCGSSKKSETKMEEFDNFIKTFEAKYIPLYKEASLASWTADLTGKDEDTKKSAALQYKMSKIFADTADFGKLKRIKESGEIKDTLKQRELFILYNAYLGGQIDTLKMKKIIDLQTKIANKFNLFRAVVGKDSLSDNKVDSILLHSTDNKKLEEVWLASKVSGKNVADSVIKLVKMRNEIAKGLGFSNYQEMSMKLSEQDPKEIEKIFDQLDSLTRDGFAKLKGDIDDYYAKRYKVKKEDLMPWHYQNRFFQEAPKIYEVDLDKYYKDKDPVKTVEAYYKGLGMDITGLVAKSDLYGRPGKYQHAQCGDMDKEGDSRVMASVVPTEYWQGTLLHEFGHAVYFVNIDRTLPFFLRDPAHTFTTEAIAELFGRFSTNPTWMKDMIGISDKEKKDIEEKVNKNLRLQMIVFSRWSQVMYRFEKSMYENPDQDLNKLWWTLVEKYQLLKKPADRNNPDWASKIHIATSPCYYHNYLLGEMLASQLHYYITKNVLKSDDYVNQSYANHPEVGQYLINKVFKPGNRYNWNDMIEKATGEKLTAKYYAKQFVE